ncbi:oligosaccharide flippase family protein [Paenibacillus sp. GSMTC-2017]|uniref:lipopolysaccharide biosynthesis protein n=1 Tax=Paenibacillus sp. GSMTC-2017 TaxID=2794350 RepID=UPI0018D798FD|nr:oligosaccharide flippase family protein [Paenibacillus sp. GSMTC-2017]MBH5317293.1 oligosaccharide flippase family protein [Paenibacillus sp. GSMTC-2017]
MRVKHSLLNMSAGLINQLIITILSFVSRTVFIHSLGIEYLGVNALFTSVLAMLSLAEAGIGSSIVYNLYKPVAEGNRLKVLALMKMYRNTYRVIAMIVVALGVMILPFLDQIVGDTHVQHLEWVYVIFLLNTALPYLFVYKHSFLNVNQKNYIVTAVFSISSIVSTSIRIAILVYTENFILYLVADSVITIATSIILARIVDRKYPYLRFGKADVLDPETKASFLKNMKAIFIQNVGTYFIFGVESIFIAKFVSIEAVGIYSNYRMLIDICRTFINQIFSNLYHSVGNLVAKESADKVFSIYKVMLLMSFWLYSMLAIGMYLLIQPLIKIWLGTEFLMSNIILIVLIVMFYERGMRNTITTVKTTAGIFHEDRYAPLIQAFINLVLSYILVKELGLVGVFIGGFISAIVVPFWTTPYLVYKKVFLKSLSHFYITYFLYSVIGFAAFSASFAIISLLPTSSLVALIVKGIVVVIVINVIYVLVFFKTAEFKYLTAIALPLMVKFVPIRMLLPTKQVEIGKK